MIGHVGPGCRTVEAAVYDIALAVEAPLDAIAAVGSPDNRPVTGCILRQDRPAEQAQAQGRVRKETSLSPSPSPRILKLEGSNAWCPATLTRHRT